MPQIYKTGTFTRDFAGAGFSISLLDGPDPNGPIVGFGIMAEQVDVPEIDISLQVAPNTGGVSGFASDPQPDEIYEGDPSAPTGRFGIAASVNLTYIPSLGVDRWHDVHGFVDIVGGLTTIAVYSSYDHPIFVRLSIHYKDPNDDADWFNPGPESPENIQHIESDNLDEFDEPTGYKNETFTWDLPVEDLVGTIIQRDGETIAVLGLDELEESIITFVDVVVPGTPYIYTFYFYYLDGAGKSDPTTYPPLIPEGDPLDIPSINLITDMTLAFEWNSVMAFIVNPSGIYGLIPNKTHDTLYNRGEEDSVDVKIPDPFVKLAFVPEE